ncbi:hypothetical protein M5K25_012753 [Dendrobium thyrsiflorum]|uniref:Uncharacterized protein n=1 Tax=Dendrobium thyrsiflorum TaxID=117978 RepID=A0ABD0UXS1_DENTH
MQRQQAEMLEEMRRMREHISSGRSTTADEETDSEFPADYSPEPVTTSPDPAPHPHRSDYLDSTLRRGSVYTRSEKNALICMYTIGVLPISCVTSSAVLRPSISVSGFTETVLQRTGEQEDRNTSPDPAPHPHRSDYLDSTLRRGSVYTRSEKNALICMYTIGVLPISCVTSSAVLRPSISVSGFTETALQRTGEQEDRNVTEMLPTIPP